MSISEQVKELRYKADIFEKSGCAVDGIVRAFREAADTIEALSAKLEVANMNQTRIKMYGEMRKELRYAIMDFDEGRYTYAQFMNLFDKIFIKYKKELI